MVIDVFSLRRPMELPQFREGFQVFKLGAEEAMRFTKKQFESLKRYPLHTNEHYIGYVMFNHGEGFIEVGYLDGQLTPITRIEDLINPNSPIAPDIEELKQELNSGWFYKVVGRNSCCQRLIMLAEQDFLPSVKHYQSIGWIDEALNPEEIAEDLRNRMVESAATERPINLSDYEKDILTDHFGLEYYKLFKQTIWEDIIECVG